MPHNAAFHQGLHCLLRQNQSSEKEIQYILKIITCDPSIYSMDHRDLTVSNLLENSIGLKRVNGLQFYINNVLIITGLEIKGY